MEINMLFIYYILIKDNIKAQDTSLMNIKNN